MDVLVSDVRFGMRAIRGTAIVLSSYPTPRSGGSTIATVEQRTDPKSSEVVPTLYSADRPSRPVLDEFWRRYSRLLLAFSLFVIVAAGEATSRRSNRTCESLDRRMPADPFASEPGDDMVSLDSRAYRSP
jgi:hypothetical protein